MPTNNRPTGFQMFKIKRRNRARLREGISIIEVLTSMAVATIGVFGIMVMIPFAVKQSQTGLDNDAANALGRNALEDFEASGFLEADPMGNLSRMLVRVPTTAPDNLVDATIPPDPPNRTLALYDTDYPGEPIFIGGALQYNRPGALHFDPIGFSGNLTEVNIPAFTGIPAPGIRIYSSTARRIGFVDLNASGAFDAGDLPAGGPVTVREAARICRGSDDIFHSNESDAINDSAPPQPLFDVAGGNQLKRQFGGRISWSAFLVPEKDSGLTGANIPVNRFRSYAIAYRDRFIDPADPVGSNYEVYLTNMAVAEGVDGFQQSVGQITFDNGFGVNTDEVRRGSWVMLINRIPDPDTDPALSGAPVSVLVPPGLGGMRYRAADTGYRLQMMFCRVTRVSDDGNLVSVDGGTFDFVPSGIDAGNGNPVSSETYMFHLRNVVSVYERSIAVETE